MDAENSMNRIVDEIIDAEFDGLVPLVVLVGGSNRVDSVTVSIGDGDSPAYTTIILQRQYRGYQYGVDRLNCVLAIVHQSTSPSVSLRDVYIKVGITVPRLCSESDAAHGLHAFVQQLRSTYGIQHLLDISSNDIILEAEWND